MPGFVLGMGESQINNNTQYSIQWFYPNALNFWLSLQNSDISIPILFYLLLEVPVAVWGCVSLCGVSHFLVALSILWPISYKETFIKWYSFSCVKENKGKKIKCFPFTWHFIAKGSNPL